MPHLSRLFFLSSSTPPPPHTHNKKQVTASSTTLLDPSPSLLDPETFAFSRAFDFERVIGRSELSEVWLAKHRGSGRRFAVKRSAAAPAPALALAPASAGAGAAGSGSGSMNSRKTAREVSVVARVPPHPNLVGVLRSWREGGAGSFIQMDYCRGGSLAEAIRRAARRSRRMQRRRRSGSGGEGARAQASPPPAAAVAVPAALPEAAVWRVAAHAAAALEALHAARVIHMDVKPENIYLDWEEKEKEENEGGERGGGDDKGVPAVVLRLGDFGLSIPAGGADQSGAGAPWEEGDGRYVAPELLSSAFSSSPFSSPRPTPAADVFSLGATLFECATGRPPPRGGDALPRSEAAAAVVAALGARREAAGPAAASSSLSPSPLPPSAALLADVIASAMLPDPRARPSAALLARVAAATEEGDGGRPRRGEADAALAAGLFLALGRPREPLPAGAGAGGRGPPPAGPLLPGSSAPTFSLLRCGDARRIRGYTLDGSASLSLSGADEEGEENAAGDAANGEGDFGDGDGDDDDDEEDSDALFFSRPPSAPRAGHSRRRTPRSAPSSPGREERKKKPPSSLVPRPPPPPTTTKSAATTTRTAAEAPAAARRPLAPISLDPLVEAMSIGGGEDGKPRHTTDHDLERALSSMSIDGLGNWTESAPLLPSPGSPTRSCSPWPAASARGSLPPAAAAARAPPPRARPRREAPSFSAAPSPRRFGFGLPAPPAPAPAPPPEVSFDDEQGQQLQQQQDLSVEGLGDTVRQLSMSMSLLSGRD